MHVESWKLDLLLFVLQYWWAIGLALLAAFGFGARWLWKRRASP